MGKACKMVLFYSLTVCTLLIFAVLGSRGATVFAENAPADRSHCIVIDPGHGGEDGGAVSRSGRPESAYNLEISERLRDLLNLLGHETKMIRTTDISVYTKGKTLAQKKASDLKERVRIANETEGALLLSIHQNYYSDDRYSGAQVFYGNTKGSEQLAKELQAQLVTKLNHGSHRQAKKSSGVYLMEHIACPGILIECGFLSNPREDAQLQKPEYQKMLCCVIGAAISQYLSNT